VNVLIVATNCERFPYAVAPLGAASVVAVLNRAGHRAELLDLCFARRTERSIGSAIERFRPDVVGISMRNLDNCCWQNPRAYFEATRRIVDDIRGCTDAEIVAGGTAISVGGADLLRYLGVNYGIAGEGEVSSIRLLRAIESGDVGIDFPGLIALANGKARVVEPDFAYDLDNLPIGGATCIEYRDYYKSGGFISVQTRRGCPFKCVYCSYPALEGSSYRLRTPSLCVDDIEKLVSATGLRDFFFVDSAFNMPAEHAMAVCEELIRRNLGIRWMAYCNPLGIDPDMARAFKASGCVGVELGLDAAVDKMLAKLGKCFSQADIKNACDALAAEELPVSLYLLFGGPEESWEDIEETQKFLEQNAKANAVFASLGLRIYRNAPLHGIAMKEGFVSETTSLLEPRFYVSRRLGPDAARKLDVLACRSARWLTVTDWESLIVRVIGTLAGRMRRIPSWKNVEGYGKHVRKLWRRRDMTSR
jgi:radical SAM superfamily enzyme YgiQ (UPF0313 family)